ncbi:MAG: phosphoribosylformylglycinamidine synthase subunit PurQ [Patescibacteria group bacterium]|jgi:phosphoribosylformylglycinamidine synthase
MKPLVLIPWVTGVNSHEEKVAVVNAVGGRAEVVPIRVLLDGRRRLWEADLVLWPGGFSFGDHGGAGTVFAIELQTRLRESVERCLERQVPMLGICNGFQVLVRAGLLPAGDFSSGCTAVLDRNRTGRFEHWRHTPVVLHGSSLWTKGLDGVEIEMPSAHGEGYFQSQGPVVVTATYGSYEGVITYPASPNGCPVAGICDETGRIMGMMPHPERGCEAAWQIYRNGIEAVR